MCTVSCIAPFFWKASPFPERVERDPGLYNPVEALSGGSPAFVFALLMMGKRCVVLVQHST